MTIPELSALNTNLDAAVIGGELDLVREACKRFDLTAFREGHLTPVFFGSALKNFGVGDLLDALGTLAPPPRAQAADTRVVTAAEADMSAFVFKVRPTGEPPRPHRLVRLSGLAHAGEVKQAWTGSDQQRRNSSSRRIARWRGGACRRRGYRHAAHRRP